MKVVLTCAATLWCWFVDADKWLTVTQRSPVHIILGKRNKRRFNTELVNVNQI